MANDLRASKSGSKLTDTAQKKLGTDAYGQDFIAEDVQMNAVIEMLKPLQEQQRNLHDEIDELQKYLIKAFGRDSDNASSQGAQGIQGIQGSKGDKGDIGNTGSAGSNGSDGSDGADGSNGTNGTNGNSHLSGVKSITYDGKAKKVVINIGGTNYNLRT